MNILNKVPPKIGLIVGGVVTLAIGVAAVLVTSKVALVALALFALIGVAASIYFAVKLIKASCFSGTSSFSSSEVDNKEDPSIQEKEKEKNINEMQDFVKRVLKPCNEKNPSEWETPAINFGKCLKKYKLNVWEIAGFNDLPSCIQNKIAEAKYN